MKSHYAKLGNSDLKTSAPASDMYLGATRLINWTISATPNFQPANSTTSSNSLAPYPGRYLINPFGIVKKVPGALWLAMSFVLPSYKRLYHWTSSDHSLNLSLT